MCLFGRVYNTFFLILFYFMRCVVTVKLSKQASEDGRTNK